MAIYSGSVLIEYGQGDIGITIAVDTSNKGILLFENLDKKHKIGEQLKTGSQEEIIQNSSVVMSFNSVESIDNFIDTLNKLKSKLIEV